MSLPSVASEPNAVVAARRPGAAANGAAASRADGAPAQPADSFASALDNVDHNGVDTPAPAPTGEPGTQPVATAQPDQTSPTGKGQTAPPSPGGVNITMGTTAVVDGATAALEAIVLAAGVQLSTDGKVVQGGKTSNEKAPGGAAPDGAAPDGPAPDGGAAAGTAAPPTDSSIPAPILAALVPVPLVSAPPTPTPTPIVTSGVQAGAARGQGVQAGAAAAGVSRAGAAATGLIAAGAATALADNATALPDNPPALPDNATTIPSNVTPVADSTAAVKVQGTPRSAPDPGFAATTSLPLPAGIDPKAIQFLATTRAGGDDKPVARTAANPTRSKETPSAPAAVTSGAAVSTAARLTAAVAQVQGNSSDSHSDDTGTRKPPHGEADAVATTTPAAESIALRSGAAATTILANASALLAARTTDASQSIGAATQIGAAISASSVSPPPTAAAPAAAAHVAASYVATVPLSGLAVEITAQARDGKNRFEIRLDPPDLGRIDVRLDVDRQGQVTSHLVVDRSETLDLLRRDAPSLERALQSAGLKTDGGVEFSLRDQSQHQSAPNAPPTPVTSPLPDDELAPVAAAQRSYWRLSGPGSGVDISV